MDFEFRDMKPYKGYEVQKAWHIDIDGKRHGNAFYLVAEGDDYVGEKYSSLAEAHRFIDSIATTNSKKG